MAARAEIITQVLSNQKIAGKYSPQSLDWRPAGRPEYVTCGIPALDALTEGCPRGQITEVSGPPSSGRTTLLQSALAAATRRGEYAALIDTCDTFDPATAARAGADLRRFVWVRCGGNVEHAMRAADLLLHGGGFGFLALDLADAPAAALQRIPLSYWFRFRRVVEQSLGLLMVLSPGVAAGVVQGTGGGSEGTEPGPPVTRSCSALRIGMRAGHAVFAGDAPFVFLKQMEYAAVPQKPARAATAFFRATAVEAEEEVTAGHDTAPLLPSREFSFPVNRAPESTSGNAPKSAAAPDGIVCPPRSSTHAGDGPTLRRRNVLTDKRSWHTHPSPFAQPQVEEEDLRLGSKRRPPRDTAVA